MYSTQLETYFALVDFNSFIIFALELWKEQWSKINEKILDLSKKTVFQIRKA